MFYHQEHGNEADLANDLRKIGDMTLMENDSVSVEVQNGDSSPNHNEPSCHLAWSTSRRLWV